MPRGFWSALGLATSIAGTVDILWAFLMAGMGGTGPVQVLRFVASGPFGNAALSGGEGWAAIGLLVHFSIMAVMVGAYLTVARRAPALLRHPVMAGLAYGVLLWLVMYWAVMPLRWPNNPLPHTLTEITAGLFSHCVLVGLPIAMIASRTFGTKRDGA